jgi:anti-anti-sigma factor
VGHQNRIDTAQVGTVAVVTLMGEHDLSTARELHGLVERLARPGACVVIDLTEASFIDSSIIAALCYASENADTSAVVAPPGTAAGRVIDLLDMTTALSTCERTDQALLHVLSCAQPEGDDAAAMVRLADDLLDAAWQSGDRIDEALALARRMSEAVGREPLIEDAKLLVARAQQCTPSEAFQRLVEQSQHRNLKLAALARDLTLAAERA